MILSAFVVGYDFSDCDYGTWHLRIRGIDQVVRCANTEMLLEGGRFIGESVPGILRLEYSRGELIAKGVPPSWVVTPARGEGDTAVVVGTFDTYDLQRNLYVIKSVVDVFATMENQNPAPAYHFMDSIRATGIMYFEPTEEWLSQRR